jgi:uncharacterized protein (DUF1778 family)
MPKKKRARKKGAYKLEEDRRTKAIKVMATAGQHEEIEEAAYAQKMSVSSWALKTLLRTARSQARKHK